MADSSEKTIKLSGITPLRSPGDDSNFLDWEFKMELALEDVKLSYVLQSIVVKDRPTSWDVDNTKACSLISRSVDDGNLKFIKTYCRDAAGMWSALCLAHEDSTSGGRMHLLQRLITTRMETDDIISHLDKLHHIFERLDSLVTDSSPLTVDEILTTSIFTSLPHDWLPVVTPLMQHPSVTSVTVIRAIKNEVTRRKTSSELSTNVVASKARATQHSHAGHRSSFQRNAKFCSYCKRRNHDVDNCWAKEEDESQSASPASKRGVKSSSSRPSTKAAKAYRLQKDHLGVMDVRRNLCRDSACAI